MDLEDHKDHLDYLDRLEHLEKRGNVVAWERQDHQGPLVPQELKESQVCQDHSVRRDPVDQEVYQGPKENQEFQEDQEVLDLLAPLVYQD